MIQLLQNDPRVFFPRLGEGSWVRILAIELHEGVDECEFKESYGQYRLRGSYIIGDELLLTFDSSLVFPTVFYEMIKSDERVVSVNFTPGWVSGEIIISADLDFDYDEFVKSYAHLGALRFKPESSIFGFWGILYHDYRNYDEFHFLEVLQNDERIRGAELNYIYQTLECESIVSQADETVIPMTRISSFPNPVMNNEVNIKVKTKGSQIFSDMLNAEMSIYNIRGQRVFVSNDFQMKEGWLSFVWNNRDNNNQPVASGVYFYRINVNEEIHTGRLLIIK